MSATEVTAGGSTAIREFHVDFAEAEPTELRRRINATRWPEQETVDDEIETAAADLDWLKKGVFVSVAGHHATGVVYETYLVQ